MSRFLLLGDILSLSEAKGTQTRFLGRRGSLLLLMWYTRVLKARVSTNGRKSRDFKIEILSLFLSLRKEKGTQKLSLSFPSLSLFTFLKCLSFVQRRCVLRARTERERERERERLYDICSRRFVSLFTKCVSLVVVGVCVGFLKKWRTFSFEQSFRWKKTEKIFQNLTRVLDFCPTRPTHLPAREDARNTFFLLTRAARTTHTLLRLIRTH